MTHRQLAGAFDCYAGSVDRIAMQREKVAKTMARWRSPGLRKSFERWLEYLEVAYDDPSAEARELAKQELLEAASSTQSKVEAEAERRIETCKRVIKRMLRHQLSLAWGQFVDCVLTTKDNRETVRKVLARMTHRQLAGAFDCYAGSVDLIAMQREKVAKTMARWRTPGIQKAFDQWLSYMDMTMSEHAEAAKELARQELQSKLESGHTSAQQLEALRAKEANRRIQMSKRVIVRMLRQHLAMAWTGFQESLFTTKKNRETVRRVLGRMKHQKLSGAFQRYSESVKDHIRVKVICTRLLQRMKQATVFKMFRSWKDTASDEVRKKRVFERTVRVWRRASLSKAWHTWIANSLEHKRILKLAEKAAFE